jgi:NAD-dependent oxidoreductase involved in siderophore biosynthesis
MPEQEPVQLTPLAKVRKLTAELVDQASEGPVSIPAIRDAVVEEMLTDTVNLQRWLEESLGPVVYSTVQSRVANTRRGIVEFGDYVMPVADVKAIAKKNAPKWMGWLEHSGNRHIRLMDMQRTDLVQASNERRARGMVELRYAALWDEMAARLGPGQRVRDIFSPEQIEELAARIVVDTRTLLSPPIPQESPAASPEENAAD